MKHAHLTLDFASKNKSTQVKICSQPFPRGAEAPSERNDTNSSVQENPKSLTSLPARPNDGATGLDGGATRIGPHKMLFLPGHFAPSHAFRPRFFAVTGVCGSASASRAAKSPRNIATYGNAYAKGDILALSGVPSIDSDSRRSIQSCGIPRSNGCSGANRVLVGTGRKDDRPTKLGRGAASPCAAG